ncbi:MAG: hypothetical protein JWN24_3943 [Phycisphaerales bacterium]|nr:hypothetical protein [Phycisphaerales bacterium]
MGSLRHKMLAVSLGGASLLALIAAGGCAKFCNFGSSPSGKATAAQASKSEGHSGRPPMPFPQESGDDPEENPAPQTVNVFGEVNGAGPRAVALTGAAAFQQHTFTDEGYDGDVCADPTGKWLVFSSTRNSEHPGIYLQRVDGTAVTQLTSDGVDNAYPSFSPDGKQIAFCSTRAGNWQIYVMDSDGRNVTQVTNGPMQCIHPSFSPDGTRLAYCSLGGRSGQWELWTADQRTGEKRMIGYGLFPSWSPDRTIDRIAFQRARQRGSRWFSLWTLDLINGEGRRVTEVAQSGNAAILSPTWSPDGKRLGFATVVQPGKGAAVKLKGQTDIWTIDADGTNRQRLTDGHGVNLMPFWSPDNRVYFVSDRGGTECIWSVRTESEKTFTAEAPKTIEAPKKDTGAVGAADVHEATH